MMPYLFGLELTTPQTGFQQRERDLSMGRLAARLSFRRTARLRKQRPSAHSGATDSGNCSDGAGNHG
ncbi:hypothetical protein [Actinoplanes sp. NPDC048796]|uniref:hypothetical protein n=1 Tax=unclassified Actinoplanes TaxID=2626549 RepID=UPI0033D09BD8